MTNKLIRSGVICLIWITLLNVPASATPIEIVDKNGNVLTGSDLSIDKTGTCTLVQAEKETSLACLNITQIILDNPAVKTKAAWEVTLNNNDLLYGKITDAIKDGFRFETNPLGKIDLRFDFLLRIRSIANSATTWKGIAEAGAEDIIYFLNGDQDKGAVKEISGDTIKFQSSVYSRDRHYKPKEIASIVFTQITKPPALPKGLLATIITTDHSRFTGLVKRIENGRVRFHSDYLGIHQVRLDKIVQIYFRTRQYRYLSDLKPVKVKEYPTIYDPKHIFFPWHYQNDKNVTSGDLISFKGKKFYKGLGVHANCELTYQLAQPYKKFFALVGLDDAAGPKASVEFMVFLDGRKAYESGLIIWGDDPKQVEIKLAKTKEIRLVVTDGGDMHVLDRAAWANARLVK